MTSDNKSQLSSSIAFLVDPNWWRHALISACKFARFCLIPALMLGCANIIILIGTEAVSNVSQLANESLESLTQKLIIGGVSSLLGLTLTIVALTLWLNCLTAFASCFTDTDDISHENVKAAFLKVKTNKTFLVKFWFLVSLILLVPALPLSFLIVLQSLRNTLVLPIPYQLMYFVQPLSYLLTLVVLSITFVAIVVSGQFNNSAKNATKETMRLTLQYSLPLFFITAIVMILNAVISVPQLIFLPNTAFVLKPSLIEGAITQLWFALSTAILWNLSLTPVVELLRRQLTSSGDSISAS